MVVAIGIVLSALLGVAVGWALLSRFDSTVALMITTPVVFLMISHFAVIPMYKDDTSETNLLSKNPAGEYVSSDGFHISEGNRIVLVPIGDGVDVSYEIIPETEEPYYEEIGYTATSPWMNLLNAEPIAVTTEYVFYVHDN